MKRSIDGTKQNFGPLKGEVLRKTWQSTGMVYLIIMDGGYWFKFTFLGQGDEHVYVHVCPGGVFIFLDGPPPGERREGAGLVVLGFRFLVMM